jgi:4-carboxymuconolactone decarboxylase
MDNELYKKGMKTRRSVLGDDHVDKAIKSTTDFDRDFQEYITTGAWGMVWDRPGLTKRERSLITIGLLAALGHDEELRMHLKATKNTGATQDDVREVLLHTAIYAGVPVANNAIKIAKELIKDKEL